MIEQRVVANEKDSYSSILKKILAQKKLKDKLGVFHMFEYTKPFIVHSDLFLEYLRIWDKEFYDFLLNKHPEIKKKHSKKIVDVLRRLIITIKKLIIKISYFVISAALVVFLTFCSLIIVFKLMEFLVKLLNGNLDNFHIFESPL
jgi:hypothetical protein